MHPLLGDQTYGGRPRPPKMQAKPSLRRYAILNAKPYMRLCCVLAHPDYGRNDGMVYPLPDDFVELLHALKADYLEHKDELDY